MRIIIDLQGAQSPSAASHELGRYSLNLAQAVARQKMDHEVILVLNALFANTIEPIRAAFEGLLPQENIRVWQSVGPIYQIEPAYTWRRKTAELTRDAFFSSLNPDVVYITSLFEGWQDNASTNIGISANSAPTVVTLYDQIPLNDQRAHLGNAVFQGWYQSKLHQLQHADYCVAISSAARTAGIEQLGLAENKVIDVSVAGHLHPQIQLSSVVSGKHSEHCPEKSDTQFWDTTAKNVWSVFEKIHASPPEAAVQLPLHRPKLAYVSPLPPERSGIADYSAEILPELAKYYDIDIISNQAAMSDLWISENCSLHNSQWLLDHATEYHRVVYHFGNSPFHQHMFELLRRVPGVVVLHDFYLSDLVAYLDMSGMQPGAWAKELYNAHGYLALGESFADRGSADANRHAVKKYPCNFDVHKHALGVVVHANYSRKLAHLYYGSAVANSWSVVPLPRTAALSSPGHAERPSLGFKPDDFVVCSFGMLGFNKLNSRLLDAWLASPLATDPSCHLIFVGENDGGEYGEALLATISASVATDRIQITGWTDTAKYRAYLAAADVGVQLRTESRGETSAAVLDCLNYGLPTIVNRNGAMAELPLEAVWMLEEEFLDKDLVDALTTLRKDVAIRSTYRSEARNLIRTRHSPRNCAKLYAEAIECYYFKATNDSHHLIEKISFLANPPHDDLLLHEIAKSITQNLPKPSSSKQIFVDVSAIIQNDLKTGIQRVVRALLMELIKTPPEGYRIEPVYLTDKDGYWHYLYARRYTLELMGCPVEKMAGSGTPESCFVDDHFEAQPGDIMAVLDLTGGMVVEAEKFGIYTQLKDMGVCFWFVIYDLLPILQPQVFPPHAELAHSEWLASVCRIADGTLCISGAVADELVEWLEHFGPPRLRPLKIASFHLGADVSSSAPTKGLPANAKSVLGKLSERPTFLMVGTVEPRKGQAQTLKAFDLLWKQGVDVNLVIVGKQGWMMESLTDSIEAHKELGRRLFWMAGISDEYLDKIYAAGSCLIAASEGEGFGLPLIEAAQHQVPIIARDIPVFKEVVGEHGFYFTGLAAEDLAKGVRAWLSLDKAGNVPQSSAMPWLTWKDSAQQLLGSMLGGQRQREWLPDGVQRFHGSDPRLKTIVGQCVGRNMHSTGRPGYLIFGPYIPLAAGQYQVMIYGSMGIREADGVRADVVADKGNIIFTESTLKKSDKDGRLATLSISLEAPCSDIEIRVWVEDQLDIVISRLEIRPANTKIMEEVMTYVEVPENKEVVTFTHPDKKYLAASAPVDLYAKYNKKSKQKKRH